MRDLSSTLCSASQRAVSRISLALATLLLFKTSVAFAQPSVQLDLFRAAPDGRDAFASSRPQAPAHLELGVQAAVDYARNPFTLGVTSAGSNQRYEIVRDQLALNVGASLGLFGRGVVFVSLPMNVVMTGDKVTGTLPSADGTTLSDPMFGGRVVIIGEGGGLFRLAAQVSATVPVANATHGSQRFSGEIGMTFVPQILAEVSLPHDVFVTANVGARLRALDNATVLRELGISHELVWSVAIGMPFWKSGSATLTGYLEGFGRNTFADLGNGALSGLEGLVGARLALDRLTVGLAGGAGVLDGYGASSARVIAMVGWHEPLATRAAAEAEPESTPAPEGFVEVTPPIAEPAPEPAPQVTDAAPAAEADQDGDGIPDSRDGDAAQAEDADGFQDEDGVPEPDNDGDGVVDAQDRCRDQAGDAEGIDGCPSPFTARVVFSLHSVELAEDAVRALEDVRQIMQAHTEIRRLYIEGHTDVRGADDANRRLSAQRARVVRDWLVAHGIARGRLVALGCGEAIPVTTEETEEAQATNRRVQFRLHARTGAELGECR